MKHNLFKVIFDIYFAKTKQLIINVIIIILLFTTFSIFQYQKIVSNGKLYEHKITFYNVPYTRDGSENWFFEGTNAEVKLREKKYKVNSVSVSDIHSRIYSNDDEKKDDFFSLMDDFIKTNLEQNINELNEKIAFLKSFHFTSYYDPSVIYTLTKKIERLQYKTRFNYTITKNVNFMEIFGISFILSFVIITLIRLLMLDIRPKKSKKN